MSLLRYTTKVSSKRGQLGKLVRTVVFLTVPLALSIATPAFAYRSARIGADSAEVKEAPSPDSAIKTVMPRGTRINTSDQPTNGYYRVRSATDTGFIRDSDIDFGAVSAPPQSSAPSSEAPHPKNQTKEKLEDRDHETQDTASSGSGRWSVKAFGGLDFWTATDLGNLVQSTSLQGGSGFGGEIDYGFAKSNWYMGFRVEKLSKSVNGSAGSDNVNFSLSSFPVMVGVGVEAAKGESFSLDLSAFVGGGFSTSVTETDTSVASPNITTLSSTAVSFVLAADLNWRVSTPFWLFVEPGYRYLKTGNITPSVEGNGTLFQQNGKDVPVDINLSGPFVNFGVRINF